MTRSPIEERLFGALIDALPIGCSLEFRDDLHGEIRTFPGGGTPMRYLYIGGGERVRRGHGRAQTIYMARDVREGSYRLDFVLGIAHGFGGVVAVECDGHEFHDRTKQQAAYDRSRDRELLRAQVKTIRFTGSEIFHNAHRCAVESFDTLKVLDSIANGEAHRAWCCGALNVVGLDTEFTAGLLGGMV